MANARQRELGRNLPVPGGRCRIEPQHRQVGVVVGAGIQPAVSVVVGFAIRHHHRGIGGNPTSTPLHHLRSSRLRIGSRWRRARRRVECAGRSTARIRSGRYRAARVVGVAGGTTMTLRWALQS